jgi:hypothetical protein
MGNQRMINGLDNRLTTMLEKVQSHNNRFDSNFNESFKDATDSISISGRAKEAGSESNVGKKPDFTNISGNELRDWVNESLLNGTMTLMESGAFLIWMNRGDQRFNLIAEMQGAADFTRGTYLSAYTRFNSMLEFLRETQMQMAMDIKA